MLAICPDAEKTSSEFRREIRKQPSILSLDTRENIPVTKTHPTRKSLSSTKLNVLGMQTEPQNTCRVVQLSSSATLSLLSCWQYSTGSRGPCLSPWWEADRKSTGVKQDGQSGDEQSMKRFRHWSIAVPPEALSGEYGAGAKLFEHGAPNELDLNIHRNLHLDTPTRQPEERR